MPFLYPSTSPSPIIYPHHRSYIQHYEIQSRETPFSICLCVMFFFLLGIKGPWKSKRVDILCIRIFCDKNFNLPKPIFHNVSIGFDLCAISHVYVCIYIYIGACEMRCEMPNNITKAYSEYKIKLKIRQNL